MANYISTYEQVLGRNHDLAQVNFSLSRPSVKSLGFRLLTDCNQNGWSPRWNMREIVAAFHDLLHRFGWRWHPQISGNVYQAGAQVLDGTRVTGECACVAYALSFIVNAPAPWGFGDPEIAKVETYYGDPVSRHGFISRHINALPGVSPNIINAQGHPLPGYYLWANHKVICYDKRLYDPNYNTEYPTRDSMSVGTLRQVRTGAQLHQLKDYNPRSLLGAFRFLAQKVSDKYWNNLHTIEVLRVTNGLPNLQGYYIGWGQAWGKLPDLRQSSNWYGPYKENPLVP